MQSIDIQLVNALRAAQSVFDEIAATVIPTAKTHDEAIKAWEAPVPEPTKEETPATA